MKAKGGVMYGQELIIDLHDANPAKFTRKDIRAFREGMCRDILGVCPEDLHFWDDLGLPLEQQQTDPKKKGTTAIQFLLTSNITIHTLDALRAVYINVFVCREFNSDLVYRDRAGSKVRGGEGTVDERSREAGEPGEELRRRVGNP